MVWTAPKTWAVDEVLTAADMNTYLRDNTEHLFDRPSDSYENDLSGNISTTSTVLVAVDATRYQVSIDSSNHVLVHFHGTVQIGAINNEANFDIAVDGVLQGDSVGGILNARATVNNYRTPVSFSRLVGPLSPGTHVITLYWSVSAGTLTMLNQAAGATQSVVGQFWAHEV
ncbi:MAG: hypothetical protein ABFS03_03975 [Chloroflexota bacterium]